MAEFGFATYDEAYTLHLDEFSVQTDAGNTRIWERASKQGYIYGVYLELGAGNYAVRCLLDGRGISILDMTVSQMVAHGMDVPNPVFPYALVADDDNGLYNWLWTPREPRIAEYKDRAYIDVAAGVQVVGKVLYAESPE
ncbi:MAG TPA: hypothetical protein PKV78_05355 [Methanoculleus thermophilus]|jgi:hypothetical protein|nr:hypothetical protein [Bacillota bacterium]HQD25953.1 hypothetical protein [Methanoculleus thermophilus]